MRSHLGTSFRVWNRRQTWFWLVLNQHRNGGTIGTATTEAEAVREACFSIEEMSAQPSSLSPLPVRTDGNALRPAPNRAYPWSVAARGWMDWWKNVARQITDRMLTRRSGLVLRSS